MHVNSLSYAYAIRHFRALEVSGLNCRYAIMLLLRHLKLHETVITGMEERNPPSKTTKTSYM